MKKNLYDTAKWLESGERVVHAVRSRAKYQIEGSIVTRMIYADFVLTDRRLAILTGLLRRRLTNELRPGDLSEVSAGKAFKGRGAYWTPVRRKVLTLRVHKDGKDATMGIAIAPDEVAAWRDHLGKWLADKA